MHFAVADGIGVVIVYKASAIGGKRSRALLCFFYSIIAALCMTSFFVECTKEKNYTKSSSGVYLFIYLFVFILSGPKGITERSG